ncbi:radical SAM protein [Spirochaetia bacterium]|nr:radical SAM protein [Spirochaetia bacterium]
MVNYRCTAACRHCLYACSPTRDTGYVTGEKMQEICGLLRSGGCDGVHIGGGEPFLDFDGLLTAIRALKKNGINLDYIETNAYFVHDEASAKEKLTALLDEGADTLCISLDPFHAEYVPYGYPLRLAELCRQRGMGFFLWKQQFFTVLSGLPPEKAHSRAVLEKHISADYINSTANAYGLHFGGRAVNIKDAYGGRKPAAALVDAHPCRNLLSTNHFHVDREGYFIPPGCTGIRLPLEEAIRGIPEGKYPAFEALYHRGLAGLLDLAKQNGFAPDESYSSKCSLCFHARHHLAALDFAGLDRLHYEESLKYYD